MLAEDIAKTTPAGMYLFKVNNRNTRTICDICSKLTIKTLEWRRRRSGVFIVNFEQILDIIKVFLSMALIYFMPPGNYCQFSSIFEIANVADLGQSWWSVSTTINNFENKQSGMVSLQTLNNYQTIFLEGAIWDG